jgi:hypothetical protein
LLGISRDVVSLSHGSGIDGPSATVDTDDSFHTYRIEVDDTSTAGTPIRVYQDELLILTDTLLGSGSNVTPEPRIWFGDGTTWAYGASRWRSFRHNAAKDDPSLLGLWHLDEGTGTVAVDSSGHGNHGVVNGAQWIEGAVGPAALRFDGNDVVHIGDSSILEPQAITVTACFRSTGQKAYAELVSKAGFTCHSASYALSEDGAGWLGFYISNGSHFVYSPTAGPWVFNGEWRHVAGTFDGSVVRLYVDGAEIGSGTATTISIAYNELPFEIGNYTTCGGGSYGFPGDLDEVAVWSRALSAEEILRIADCRE